MKLNHLNRSMLIMALVGVCTSSLVTCANAADAAVTDTTAESTAAVTTEAVTTAIPAVKADAAAEVDINAVDRIENYFTSDIGGWTADTTKDTLKDGAITITEKSTTTRSITYPVKTATAFEIEFRAKSNETNGGERGFKYEFAGQRIMMYFREQGVSLNADADSHTIDISNITDWHTYKFTVSGSQAMVYVDGEHKLTYIMQTRDKTGDEFTFFVNSGSLSIDYFKYAHADTTISLVSPLNETNFIEGSKTYLKAACSGAAEGIPYVDFYANGTYVGTATKEDDYSLEWTGLVPGTYAVKAQYGDFSSIASIMTVTSTAGTLFAVADAETLSFGESTTVSLKRVPNTTAYVTYYANGVELAPTPDNARKAVYTANTVGKVVISAKVTYNDGSHEYAADTAVNVTANTTAGVVLQSGYTASFKASDAASVTASDGIYALKMAMTPAGMSYETSEGSKTYPLGVGDYKVQVDSGNAEVYYEGQYAFSFLMPVTTAANGITATGVDGLTLSGVNATRLTLADGTSSIIPGFTQDYAVEWVLDNPADFSIELNDGVYLTDLDAKNGQLIAQTYPNGSRGVVEEDTLCTLPAGRHAYRLTVSNGIAQLFIDNVWTASLRLPVSYAEPNVKLNGTGTVYVRETADLYTHEDSFDGSAEYGSDVYWRALSEKITVTLENGAMTLAPNPNYVEESKREIDCSFDSEATKFSGAAATVADGIMIVSTDNSEKTQTVTYDVAAAKNFEFEIMARAAALGKETGIKLEYADSRIMTYMNAEGYRVQQSVDGSNKSVTHQLDVTQWHTYKFIITDGTKGEFFIDGESKGTFTMPVWNGTSSPKMAVFVKANDGSTAAVEVDYAKFTVLDAEVEVESPINEATPALIKAYAYNPNVKTTVRVDNAPADGKGGVYIAARYDNEYRNILAGYNFATGAWEIVRTSTVSKVIGSTEAAFPYGKDTELELTVDGENIALYVNGEREVSTNQATLAFYGNVGVAVNNVTAVVSDFSYSGTGRVIPGAETFINGVGSPDILELEEGHLFMISGSRKYGSANTVFESTDDGYTWTKSDSQWFTRNTIRLKSGTIVSIARDNAPDGVSGNYIKYAYVSTDNGKTFEGPFPVMDYYRNRITMNNKLTEGSTGRLFFASGESGDGVEGEGGVRVFYSDDEGRTWTGANMLALDGKTVISGGDEARMDAENTGVNCQESRVVEMPDGTLRLYHRTDEGFLYYSISTDNGATWTAEMWKSEFISVLSAFNIERDPDTGYYYMAWAYNNKNDQTTIQRPRTRVGLAVSYDGMESWEYIGDIQETAATTASVGHMNIGLKVTKNAIYVNTVYQPITKDGSGINKNYNVRIDKATLKTTERFTKVHALVTAEPSLADQNTLNTMLLVDAAYTNAYTGGKMFELATPTAGYISTNVAAAFIGAKATAADNTVTLKIAGIETVFTAGSTTVTVNGEAKTISAAPVMNPDGMYIPIDTLTTLFNRELTTASNGSIISINNELGIVTLSTDDLAGYLPADAINAPVSEPSSWAAAEVNAALAADIVPASLKSAYQNGITRAEFCTLIMTMLNKVNGTADSKALVEKLGKTYADNFTDTDNADIICANLIGIVNGRGNGIFDPTAGITRQEAAVMLANASKVLGITAGTAPAFTDIGEAGTWAHDAIGTVASIIAGNGSAVMGGTGNGGFSPLGTYTREQSIMTVYRLFTAK